MKKFFPIIKPLICFVVCGALLITFLCLSIKREATEAEEEQSVITVWQVDSFEGGKGSRADYLQKIGREFSELNGCYVTVVSLSSEAVRMNIQASIFPDVISYGAGMYGIESYISQFTCWCYGGYCLLSLDASADFSDVTSENTVINAGKDNLSGAAALFCGLQGAASEKPTAAYLKLINGNCKYLLGTQRDIYRLKTRGVSFTVKPVTQFNDLYQNISVIAESNRKTISQSFIDFLLTKASGVNALGLMTGSVVYDDEMKLMQGVDYEYKLTSPVNENRLNDIKQLISGGDINMLKKLLK